MIAASRSVVVPQGAFEYGEVYAVVLRCGCGDPDSHTKIPVVVYSDLDTFEYGLRIDQVEFEKLRERAPFRYEVSEFTTRSEPCPTPSAREDNGLVGRVDGSEIRSFVGEQDVPISQLLVEFFCAAWVWICYVIPRLWRRQ